MHAVTVFLELWQPALPFPFSLGTQKHRSVCVHNFIKTFEVPLIGSPSNSVQSCKGANGFAGACLGASGHTEGFIAQSVLKVQNWGVLLNESHEGNRVTTKVRLLHGSPVFSQLLVSSLITHGYAARNMRIQTPCLQSLRLAQYFGILEFPHALVLFHIIFSIVHIYAMLLNWEGMTHLVSPPPKRWVWGLETMHQECIDSLPASEGITRL